MYHMTNQLYGNQISTLSLRWSSGCETHGMVKYTYLVLMHYIHYVTVNVSP